MVNTLSTERWISASCLISDGAVYKNEKLLFSAPQQEPNAFLPAAYEYFQVKYPKFYKMDSLSKLGWLAAEVLLKDDFQAEKYSPYDIGVALANANSSLDSDIKYYASVANIASPALFVYTLPNIMIGEICIRHRFKGENAFFIFEQFNAAFIQQYVDNLFNNNTLQACICGWVDLLEDQYKAALFLIERGK